jgi:anti-sigma regulatory factor (Ser/Thr protein kinase)
MILLGELRLEARLDSLHTISQFVHSIGHRLRLTERTLFHLDLAIEEAAANIVDHAYPADQAGEMLLRAEVIGDALRITFTDWGLPLDPSAVKPFDIHTPIAARSTGGMGLHFIHSLMDSVVRETAPTPGGPNVLVLTKHIERDLPEAQPCESPPGTLQELSAMLTISQIVATNANLDDLLQSILDKLVTIVQAERGMVYLLDEEKGELVARVLLAGASDTTDICVKLGEGIAGHVVATGEALNVQHAADDPRTMHVFDQMTRYGCRTTLAVPMCHPHQKIVGVVQLLNKAGPSPATPCSFTLRDERLLMAMATQAAIVIQNARTCARKTGCHSFRGDKQ